MTTSSTSSVIAQTSNATFQAWVQEVYTNLVTTCGLSQMPALMDTGQMAVPCATAVPGGANASAGYYIFVFNDTTSAGPISTTVLGSGGSGYNAGGTATFTNVPLTGGTGSGAQGTIVVTAGVAANATITTAGSGYLVGDTLSASNTNLGGSGSGLVLYVNKVTSAAAPVVLKMEFGSGSAAADPMIWITMGTGWTSNGTLNATSNGAVTTRVACFQGAAPLSTVTAYTSRYVYNSTYGYLGLVFKIGALAANCALGCLMVFRTSDNAGAVTKDAACLIANSASNSGASSATVGAMQCMSYTGNTIYPTLSQNNSSAWSSGTGSQFTNFVFGLAGTLENSVAFVFPIFTMDPAIRFSAYNGVALVGDFPLGNTASYAMVGSTALTFVSCGLCFGSSAGMASDGNANQSFCMLWQ